MTRLLTQDEIVGADEILGNFIVFCIKHARQSPDWDEFGSLLLNKLCNDPPKLSESNKV